MVASSRFQPGLGDEDKYGRELRTVTRERRSVGDALVDEGPSGAGTAQDTDGAAESHEKISPDGRNRVAGSGCVREWSRAVRRRCLAQACLDLPKSSPM